MTVLLEQRSTLLSKLMNFDVSRSDLFSIAKRMKRFFAATWLKMPSPPPLFELVFFSLTTNVKRLCKQQLSGLRRSKLFERFERLVLIIISIVKINSYKLRMQGNFNELYNNYLKICGFCFS